MTSLFDPPTLGAGSCGPDQLFSTTLTFLKAMPLLVSAEKSPIGRLARGIRRVGEHHVLEFHAGCSPGSETAEQGTRH